MEDVVASLGLPTLTPLLVIVVFVSVWLIQGLKRILTMYVKGRWTQRIPTWVWWLLSVAVPMGIVYIFNLDYFSALIRSASGGMETTLPGYGEFATGMICSMSSNGVYAGLKRLGLTGDYKPGGPNDKTGPLPEPEPAPVPPPVAPEVLITPEPINTSQSENVMTQPGNVAPAHWPTATPIKGKLVKQLTPKTEANYYFIPTDVPLYEVERGE